MRRFMRSFRRGEKGFTLIELLIVIAILGIIAAVVIPNAAGFMVAGTLNAANTETANVKTASVGYMAENAEWPNTGGWATGPMAGTDYLAPYLSGTVKASYAFSDGSGGVPAGQIRQANPGDWGTAIVWNLTTQMWERVP